MCKSTYLRRQGGGDLGAKFCFEVILVANLVYLNPFYRFEKFRLADSELLANLSRWLGGSCRLFLVILRGLRDSIVNIVEMCFLGLQTIVYVKRSVPEGEDRDIC